MDRSRTLLLPLAIALVVGAAAAPLMVAAQTSQPGTLELSQAPPDLKPAVDPNIVVTFDDSGSMAYNYMGDTQPFNNASWNGPWRCAGVIDPRVDSAATGLTAEQQARTETMNGVYFNPAITYSPPLYKDGTPFPNADASLFAVWLDGIAVNRPAGAVTAALIATFANNPNSGLFANDSGRANLMGQRLGAVDNRWRCGWTTNPLSNAGGPYYFRLRTGVNIVAASGAIDTAALYTVANWEAVAVAATDYQNFANWYAYYRTRTLMTRSALSRVFGVVSGAVRISWQNINAAAYRLPASTIITALNDDGTGSAANYRTRFFNWIYQVPADGGTPNRSAAVRAGEFFKRSGSDLKNPYWQPGAGTAPGRELSCRQNYHMLVTDGFWNETTIINGYSSRDLRTLPDGKAYDPAAAASLIFPGPVTPYGSGLADIAFHYWATDLRPTLTNNVAPYFSDRTTGITGTTALGAGDLPTNNPEVYFNPVNDPATWQHVVQFMVTLGVSGRLTISGDVDCADPNSDLCKLRKGQANSTGAIGWPTPLNNDRTGLDDTWHAALNSRGAFFNAGNPSTLVTYLSDILNSIVARRGTSTSIAVSLPILTTGTAGFRAGYDSGDWAGFLHKVTIDPISGAPTTVLWDAACLLTGGSCASTASSVGAARNPLSRVIITSDGQPGTGKAFRWTSLDTDQQALLDRNPVKTQPESAWVGDGNGSLRLDYLRGDRSNEAATATPRLRQRSSVLGAVINAQPEYVSSPTGGFSDNFPFGTREEIAARGMNATPYVAANDHSYAKFQYDNRARAPTVYVAANDGMLHAFNANDGRERWAYVPNLLFSNGKLNRMTSSDWSLVSGVDDRPVVQDVCIGGSAATGCVWKTVLIGAMRLGARGIYALDISNPAGVTEATAAAVPLWEFSNAPPATGAGSDCAADARYCSSLGYTFDSVNIARLNNGRWVVLLSSGYFPKYAAGCAVADCTAQFSADTAANRTSLLVIDLETGQLIREIPASTAVQPTASGFASFGMSKPVVYDFGSNLIDDLAISGDLAGNLWRFDLSDVDPANWSVDRIFSNYGSSSGRVAGDQPITVMPVPMTDPFTRQPIYIFGTGKFIGDVDRQSAITAQAFYGIRDYGTASANYPINPAQLVSNALTQTADGVRSIARSSSIAITSAQRGWTIPLNIAAEPGERNVVAATPLYSNNQAILTTLVPVGDDPCSPGRRGAVMIVDAGTGGAASGTPPVTGGSGAPPGTSPIGRVLTSYAIPSVGSLPILISPGGGSALIPGIDGITPPANYWTRSAWRTLLDLL